MWVLGHLISGLTPVLHALYWLNHLSSPREWRSLCCCLSVHCELQCWAGWRLRGWAPCGKGPPIALTASIAIYCGIWARINHGDLGACCSCTLRFRGVWGSMNLIPNFKLISIKQLDEWGSCSCFNEKLTSNVSVVSYNSLSSVIRWIQIGLAIKQS